MWCWTKILSTKIHNRYEHFRATRGNACSDIILPHFGPPCIAHSGPHVWPHFYYWLNKGSTPSLFLFYLYLSLYPASLSLSLSLSLSILPPSSSSLYFFLSILPSPSVSWPFFLWKEILLKKKRMLGRSYPCVAHECQTHWATKSSNS